MSSNFSFDTVWDEQIAISQGADDLMVSPDGSYVRKSAHDQELAAQAAALEAEQTNPSMIAGEVTPQTPGQVAQSFGEMVLGASGGATAATLGLLGDSYGAVKGIFDSIGAENGQRLSTFLESFTEQSDTWGSGKFIEMYQNFINGLDIPAESKEMALAGSKYLGEWSEIPGAVALVVKGLKGASKAMRAPSRTAQQSQQLDLLDNEPIIIENPDAGPLDRSQLPQRMPKPEAPAPDIDELGFYQKSIEALNRVEQKKGTAQQFIKRLIQQGVTQDEIDAIGLPDAFEPNQQITIDEFRDYIERNRVELERSVRAGDPEGVGTDLVFQRTGIDEDAANWDGQGQDLIYDLENPGSVQDTGRTNAWYAISRITQSTRGMEELTGLIPDETTRESVLETARQGRFDELPSEYKRKLEDAAYETARDEYLQNPYEIYNPTTDDYDLRNRFTIFGNDDIGYQVIFDGVEVDQAWSLGEAEILARSYANDQGLLNDLDGGLEGADGPQEFGRYLEHNPLYMGENYREILLKDPENKIEYKGPHWNDPNIIGSILTSDRTDSLGRKTMFLEEVQSDWGQSSRKQMNELQELLDRNKIIEQEEIPKLQKELDDIEKQLEIVYNPDDPAVIAVDEDVLQRQRDNLQEEKVRLKTALKIRERTLQSNSELYEQYKPGFEQYESELKSTRFVKDTQSWLRPTLKIALAEAIEAGYDTITISTTDVMKARWGKKKGDFGDFYPKTVPNTLLKVAKQLDKGAKLTRSDLRQDALGYAASTVENTTLGRYGMGEVYTIEITPAMREAYKKKGQSLFTPAAIGVTATKIAVDATNKDQNND